MKKNLLGAFTILIIPLFLTAQIAGPVTRANFGVEAELRANFFNGTITSVGDDWFNNGTAGTGQFIIDTTGAAAIVAAYTSQPASRMWPFSRLMRQAPYSVVNNRLLIDAIFTRDFHGDDSTVFAAGSNKNGDSPANWTTPISQGIPDKNDILDAMIHVRRAGPNITDSLWMFGGISIENTTGNRYFDFELYQTDFYYDRPALAFRNYGPEEGHTAWLFNPDGSIQRPGDIIFTAEYSSSALTLVEARIWVHQSSLLMTPMFFNWGGLFDGASASAVYGYASILPKTAGAFYTGLQCPNGVWPGPFSLIRTDNSLVATYIARQYMEFSVNLSKLGLDPAYISTNGCGTPFRRALIKTRASTSFTAELKDFVAPFRMFDFPYPNAVAQMPIFCGEIGVSDISVVNPSSTSTYNWTTTNGNIISSPTGPTITVDTTGTYIVTQYLHSQCPAYAYDTVNITFDSLCLVLDKNLTGFSGVMNNRNTTLHWNVLQNEQVGAFAVEYSTDNINFHLVENVNPSNEYGVENYSLNHNTAALHAPVIYYRLQVTGRNRNMMYSNVIALRTGYDVKPGLLIYPNPSNEQVWASIVSANTVEAEYFISDMSSKLISRKKVQLYAGNNTISLSELENNQPGVYFIKLMLDGKQYVQKIIISK
jgi:Secretion system C-terminal sorting domain